MNKNKSGADTYIQELCGEVAANHGKLIRLKSWYKIVGLKIDAHNFFLLV